MKKIVMKNIAAIFLLFLLMSFIQNRKEDIRVYLIGDSTMSVKDVKAYPETGWGMPFAYFFDSTVKIDNRAKNGRSTKSFIAENLWQPIVGKLKEGDYVLIQFGHNGEVQTKATSTKPREFKDNLVRYVNESRGKKAIPILLTPAARRSFDSVTGKIVGTHDTYSVLVREVAKEHNVHLIDLDVKSQALLQKLGIESSKLLFNHLKAGEHPNYPSGKEDNTHFNELGARLVAQIVLKEIKDLNIELANRVIKPIQK